MCYKYVILLFCRGNFSTPILLPKFREEVVEIVYENGAAATSELTADDEGKIIFLFFLQAQL
jgi:hypothetical protein